MSEFRQVRHSQPFHVDSKSRSGKQLEEASFVHFALANSHSFRVVTVTGSAYSARRLIELWDAGSGSLLWEKEGEYSSYYAANSSNPRFSEDGRYLAVYDGNWVEIINAHSAQSTGVVAVNAFQPHAVALGNDGTSLALSRADLEERGFGPGALFEKSFLDEGKSPIDLVLTSGFSDVQLCYASDGNRLVMAGHFDETRDKRVVLMFWDVKSCKTISHGVYGEKGSSIDGPLLPVHNLDGMELSGVILRLDNRRWINIYNDSDFEYDEDNEDRCEKLTTFTTFTSEGKQNGNYVTEHEQAVCAVTHDGLVFIKNRNYLWSWKGGSTEPKRMGRIDFKTMPTCSNIKTFALSKGRLTLSSRYPHSLVFLGVEGQGIRKNHVGSIVLGKKRKTPDE